MRSDEHETKTGRMGVPSAIERTADTEAALQQELRRESAEGRGAIGDLATNQNLSGSSTWATLPDDAADAADGAK